MFRRDVGAMRGIYAHDLVGGGIVGGAGGDAEEVLVSHCWLKEMVGNGEWSLKEASLWFGEGRQLAGGKDLKIWGNDLHNGVRSLEYDGTADIGRGIGMMWHEC